jgi:membrane associated rhomboid family serine protease
MDPFRTGGAGLASFALFAFILAYLVLQVQVPRKVEGPMRALALAPLLAWLLSLGWILLRRFAGLGDPGTAIANLAPPVVLPICFISLRVCY